MLAMLVPQQCSVNIVIVYEHSACRGRQFLELKAQLSSTTSFFCLVVVLLLVFLYRDVTP